MISNTDVIKNANNGYAVVNRNGSETNTDQTQNKPHSKKNVDSNPLNEVLVLQQLSDTELKQHAQKMVADNPNLPTRHILSQVLQLSNDSNNSSIDEVATQNNVLLNTINSYIATDYATGTPTSTTTANPSNVTALASAPQPTEENAYNNADLNPMLQALTATLLIMQQSDNSAKVLTEIAKIQNTLLDTIGQLSKFLATIKTFYTNCLLQKQQEANTKKQPAPTQIDWTDPEIKQLATNAGYTVTTGSDGKTNLNVYFNTTDLPAIAQKYAFTKSGGDYNGKMGLSSRSIENIIKDVSEQLAQVLPNTSASSSGELYDTWSDGTSNSTKNDQFMTEVANKVKSVSDSAGNLSSQISIYQNNKDNAKQTVDTIIQAMLQAMAKLYS